MSGRGYYAKVKTDDTENFKYYAADFETTTGAIDPNKTRVWLLACYERNGTGGNRKRDRGACVFVNTRDGRRKNGYFSG